MTSQECFKALKSVFECTGVAVITGSVDTTVATVGEVPSEATIVAVYKHAMQMVGTVGNKGGLWSTSCLAESMPACLAFDDKAACSGVLCLPMKSTDLEVILLFRHEKVRHSVAASPPHAPVTIPVVSLRR